MISLSILILQYAFIIITIVIIYYENRQVKISNYNNCLYHYYYNMIPDNVNEYVHYLHYVVHGQYNIFIRILVFTIHIKNIG